MKPYKWQSVQATGEGPCARMYAAAAARADGLLLLCGGRDSNNAPLVRSTSSHPFYSLSAHPTPSRTSLDSRATETGDGNGPRRLWLLPPPATRCVQTLV